MEKEFTPPRHWIGPEELEASYWSDPKNLEKRGQEFHDKPIETLELIDRMDRSGLARREFLTIMGASMALAGTACARRPVHKIIPYVVKPEEITPGVANWYASCDPELGLGVLVKTREGRPIKLEGNPDCPISKGALTARGQAAILDLYDPDRLQNPISQSRGGAGQTVAAWKDIDAKISAQLKGSKSVRLLTGAIAGDTTRKLIREFLGSVPSGSHIEYEPLSHEEIQLAQNESYGTSVTPTYHFDRAEVIVSFGADFMSTWLSPVEHSRGWSANRKLNSKNHAHAKLSKLITFESTMSVTGTNSDERVAIRAGDEYLIAMALAHEIIVANRFSKYVTQANVANALTGYSCEAVSKITGIEAATLKKIAHTLWQAHGKSLVVGGGLAAKTENAVALQVAVNLLNSALDNEGFTVDGTLNPDVRPAPEFAKLEKLVSEMKSGQVDTLVIANSNPVYSLPPSLGFKEALAKVKTVIVITDREDETAKNADYILPDHHYLENWGDARLRKHFYGIQQPVIAPLYNTRSFQDTLLAWSKPGQVWHDYLKNNWKETLFKEYRISGNFEQFWEGSLRSGHLNGLAANGQAQAKSSERPFRMTALALLPKFQGNVDQDVHLALYAKGVMHDGRHANNSWVQEMPDPITSATWDNYVAMGTVLAQHLGVKQDDVVAVKTDVGTFELPVLVQPGIHPRTIAVAVGYGRESAGRVGSNIGANLFAHTRVQQGKWICSGGKVQIAKTGKYYRLATTQWHFATENRPVVNDVTLAEYQHNAAAANHTNPHLREELKTMWAEHKYPGYRWGMAIDLNSCTGCGACTIACQSENNIPVVGRNNVRMSRQMHWIRIDRYFSGSPENPDAVYQPMLCQHCENAPCETVCPVLATVHDDEGTSNQAYNRCVGTRYCQNNCPYKTRRFNFFDHWKNYEGNMNLAWNPDVTVRTRGIMEKCSFCIQRINESKMKAKREGRKVKDGDLLSACQQTCPTEAISFGNMNDPESKVAKMMSDPRGFRSLEGLNVRPSVVYLTKVRNKEGSKDSGGAHHG